MHHIPDSNEFNEIIINFLNEPNDEQLQSREFVAIPKGSKSRG